LAIGDIVAKSGLAFLSDRLRSIKKNNSIDFTVVNGENAANMGITPSQAEDIFAAGADVITLGNHTFGKKEICDYLDDCPYILRPANYASQAPGRGWGVYEAAFGEVCVINLIGRCDMPFGPDNPFFAADKILSGVSCRFILADMHAEATSEKLAMGYYLDGRVSAVWGTHTHVQTSDGGLLPKGTGYITDLGMTGPSVSVLGVKAEQSISMFLGNPHHRFEAADGACKMECAVFTLDEKTGLCLSVEAMRVT
jgi:metallophosphoesterase (TIGR00282 family)